LRTLLTIPVLFHFTVALWLLAGSYYFYFFEEDHGEVPPDDRLRIWAVGSALLWISAAVLLVIGWKRRDYLVVWLTPVAWFGATYVLHEACANWFY
jgi:hypothetical protein